MTPKSLQDKSTGRPVVMRSRIFFSTLSQIIHRRGLVATQQLNNPTADKPTQKQLQRAMLTALPVFCVVNRNVSAHRLGAELNVAPAAGGGNVRAKGFGDLDPQVAHAAGAAVEQHALAGQREGRLQRLRWRAALQHLSIVYDKFHNRDQPSSRTESACRLKGRRLQRLRLAVKERVLDTRALRVTTYNNTRA